MLSSGKLEVLCWTQETNSQETIALQVYGLEAADYSILEKSLRYRMTEEGDQSDGILEMLFLYLKGGQNLFM